MESRANVIAAGLFVIALTVGLIATALWLTRDSIDRVPYLVVARIPVSGLHAKAAVRLRGVDVGRVDGDRASIHRTGAPSWSTSRWTAAAGLTQRHVRRSSPTRASPACRTSRWTTTAAGRSCWPRRTRRRAASTLRPSLIDGLSDSSRDLLHDAAQVAHRLNLVLGDDNLARMSAARLRNTEAAAHQMADWRRSLQPVPRNAAGPGSRHATLRSSTWTSCCVDLHGADRTQLGQHLGGARSARTGRAGRRRGQPALQHGRRRRHAAAPGCARSTNSRARRAAR